MNQMIAIHIKSLKRALPLLALASLTLSLSTYFIASSLGPTYEAHYSYLVSLKSRDVVPDYRYDGYYALQATDLLSATLAQWTMAPEVIVAALNEVGLPVSSDVRSLTRFIRAEKVAPQLVAVTVTGESAAVAERLATGLQKVMERNVARYHDQGIPEMAFQVTTTDTWTGQNQLQSGAMAVAVLVAALFLGINTVLLGTSIKYWPA